MSNIPATAMPYKPRISFGIIILNGEPFTRYCLRSLYPHAHEIIIVEGACKSASSIATADGHSIDGTLETLYQFADKEDPRGIVHIIQRDGYWDEKDEQSQAYAAIATGDYLWQVDIDEFYKHEDMAKIIRMLKDDRDITAVSFMPINFWGSLELITEGWYRWRGVGQFHRLFKWDKRYSYHTHRPPTVLDENNEDLRSKKWIKGKDLAKAGIYLYHYSLLLPKIVIEKCNYYTNAKWADSPDMNKWVETCYLKLTNPFRVHNTYRWPSWLENYAGSHPDEISRLWIDIKEGRIETDLRSNDDITHILKKRRTKIGIKILKFLGIFDCYLTKLGKRNRLLAKIFQFT